MKTQQKMEITSYMKPLQMKEGDSVCTLFFFLELS